MLPGALAPEHRQLCRCLKHGLILGKIKRTIVWNNNEVSTFSGGLVTVSCRAVATAPREIGLVTTPTVSAPASFFAISAAGAAPVPVPAALSSDEDHIRRQQEVQP